MGPYSGSGTRVELGKRVGRSLVYFKNQLTTTLHIGVHKHTFCYLFTLFWFSFLWRLSLIFISSWFSLHKMVRNHMTCLFWPSSSHKEGLAVAVPFSCSFCIRRFIWAVNRQCYCHLEGYGVALPGVRVLQFTMTLNMGITSEILGLFGN